jgi:V-type H+-transporting ATPase subunit a
MLFMIILKWLTNWEYNWDNKAPNLISVTMNMFLKLGSLEDQTPLWGDKTGQESIQLSLMLIAVICVPLMWLVKPIYENYHHKKVNGHIQEAHPGMEIGQKYQQFEGEEQHIAKVQEFDFGEEFVHQSIETIEFVLGCVSNTASYLRLWALSLAHGQLSKVFFEKCIGSTIESGNPLLVVVGFFVFANVTIGVLMSMDAMECFLHALRLHWVEFQSKFYKGDGIKFLPFSFEQVFTAESKA